ncbi:MAG: hypothetical protein E7214_03255 [Clostridium sp.]|nr:hypothetical protein [Clostridium sp.]
MKKRTLLMLLFMIFMSLVFSKSDSVSAAVDETHPGFRVEGRFLYDNQDEKTILYGINKMVVWQDKDGDPSFSEIAKTGANCVRIVWTMKDGTQEELDTAIKNCRAEHMIPIIELHDATGEFDKLPSLVDWWTDPKTVEVIKKHQEYLIINIGNEIGNTNVSDATFTKGYIDAVTKMREAGIHVPLMIDPSSWGQDINKVQACGPEILKADPDSNLIFSPHLWWPYMYGHTEQEVIDELTESVNMNLPIVIGEFANQWEETSQGQIPYKTIMEYCAKYEIGYLIWSWGPGNNPQKFLDMTTDGTFDTMQDWAKEMVFDSPYALSKLAVRPVSMLTGMPAQMPAKPLPSGNLAQGKKVVSSSRESILYDGNNITDGNLSTRWASSSNEQTGWVYVDLGATKNINEVLINWENAYATQYKIQVSNDATTWKDVFTTFNGLGGNISIPVTASGRYVRIYCTQKFYYSWGYSIFELGVYGPDSKLSASVSPTAMVFDKNVEKQEDLEFTLDSKDNTLTSIVNGDATLVEGTDYIVDGDKLTITKEYLNTLEKGSYKFTLVYDEGVNPVINVAIGNTAPLPYLRPCKVEFNKKVGSSKDITVTLGKSCSKLTGILNGETVLVEGTDYTVEDNEVTISKDYLMTIPLSTIKLTFTFEDNQTLSLITVITDTSESSVITLKEAKFEKQDQADIVVPILLNGNTLKSIVNGDYTLEEGKDYTIKDGTVIISKEYLASLSVGETELTFVFSAGKDSILPIKVTNTLPNSVVTPGLVTYDIAAPEEVKVTLTLNGNTLDKITNGNYVLVEGEDYTVEENVVTISEKYLATLKNGTTKLTFVFSGGENQILAIKVTDSSKVPANTDIEVTFSNCCSQEIANGITPRFKITNKSSEALDLSNLKLRYYFTTDGNEENCFWCDWSSVGGSNVKGEFVKMAEPTETADCYLEISFSEDTEKLAPNASAYVQCRFSKSNWASYNQKNDYSYEKTSDYDYKVFDKITTYYNNSLILGVEP